MNKLPNWILTAILSLSVSGCSLLDDDTQQVLAPKHYLKKQFKIIDKNKFFLSQNKIAQDCMSKEADKFINELSHADESVQSYINDEYLLKWSSRTAKYCLEEVKKISGKEPNKDLIKAVNEYRKDIDSQLVGEKPVDLFDPPTNKEEENKAIEDLDKLIAQMPKKENENNNSYIQKKNIRVPKTFKEVNQYYQATPNGPSHLGY
ncbi:hypothetical protein KVC54_01005 [Helicobacter pylori]|nr:hypothetical protein KVC54_01005 [Helicobacter pylori]